MSWAGDEWKDGLSAKVLEQISKLEKQITDIEKEKKQFKFQAENGNASIAKLKKQEEELSKEINKLTMSRDKRAEKVVQLETVITELQKDLREKDVMIENLRYDLDHTKKLCEQTDAEKQNLELRIQELQQEQRELEETLHKQTASVEKETPIKSKKCKPRSDGELSSGKKDEIDADISKLMDENTQLRMLYDSQKKTIEDLQRKLSSASCGSEDSSYDLEKPRSWSNEEISRLQEELKAAKDMIKSGEITEKEKSDLLESKKELTDEIESLQGKINSLRSDLQKAKINEDKLKEVLEETQNLNRHIKSLKKEKYEQDSKLQNMYERVEESKTEIFAKESRIEELSIELQRQSEKNGALENQLQTLQKELDKQATEMSMQTEKDVEQMKKSGELSLEKKIDLLRSSSSDLLKYLRFETGFQKGELGLDQMVLQRLRQEMICFTDTLNTMVGIKTQSTENGQGVCEVTEDQTEELTSPRSKERQGGRRNERWNVEVFDLRLKVSELERRNRELKNQLECPVGVVGELRRTFEITTQTDYVSPRSSNKAKEIFHEKKRKLPKTDSRSYDDLLRANRMSEEKLAVLNSERDRWERIVRRKDETIQLLERNLEFLAQEKRATESKLSGPLRAKIDEVEALKKQIKENEKRIKRLSAGLEDKKIDIDKPEVKNEFKNADSEGKLTCKTSSDVMVDEAFLFPDEDSELMFLLQESYDSISYLENIISGQKAFCEKMTSENILKTTRSLTNVMSAECITQILLGMGSNDFSEKFKSLKEALKEIELRVEEKDRIIGNLMKKLQTLGGRHFRCSNSKSKMDKEDTELASISNTVVAQSGNLTRNQERVLETWQSEETIHEGAQEDCSTISTNGTVTADRILMRSQARKEIICNCDELGRQLKEAKEKLNWNESQIEDLKKRNKEADEFWKEKLRQLEKTETTARQIQEMSKGEFTKQEKKITKLETKLAHQTEKTNNAVKELKEAKAELKEKEEHPKLEEQLAELKALLIEKVGTGKAERDEVLKLHEDLAAEISAKSEKILKEVHDESCKAYMRDKAIVISKEGCLEGDRDREKEAKLEQRYSKVMAYKSRSSKIFEEKAYVTAKQVLGTLDEIEKVKCSLCYVQDDVDNLLNTLNKVEREKESLNQEITGLLQTLQVKEEEIEKLTALLDKERNAVDQNEIAYQSELEVLKVEQIEVYKEFRDLCESYKSKEVELCEKSKVVATLEAQLKETEANYASRIKGIEKDLEQSRKEVIDLNFRLDGAKSETQDQSRRVQTSCDQLSALYQRLTCIENMFYDCRQKGLYK